MSQQLRSTGILDAYEKLLTNIYQNGWPGDKSIFNYAAEEILRYGSKHQQEFKGIIGKEIEKKSRVIGGTLDIQQRNDTPKNIISMKRDPNKPLRVKNNIDLSIFDKPRVQLSRSIKDSDKIRDSKKEEDFLQLNFQKPKKKEIILADNPDFTLDKKYYEEEFEKPPEQDEDLLKMSMKSGHRGIDAEPAINLSQSNYQNNEALGANASQLVYKDDSIYQKNEELDETHRQSQLMNMVNDKSLDDGINIHDSKFRKFSEEILNFWLSVWIYFS